MSIAPGTRLGPYEIANAIGAGGMGDVYKARDTRLGRTVAVKIVRTDFSERFEREARSISALNHPNICTLHDVGNQDGVAYLVMELVEGSPIAGPLPIADVIRYGIQICDALDAAHRKSIVHRDLKPANILATKAGIKLLDFGLAKLQTNTRVATDGSDATVAALTGAHTIIGTPQYMAPEQIEGREADARTDIFALGCVLYELITGKRAFEGKTASNAMAAVLATEPRRLAELAPVTPPALEWVVSRCLEKDPDARWQSARDVALQLRWVADQGASPAAVDSKPDRRRTLMTGVAIGAVIGSLATAAWFWSRAAKPGASTGGPLPVSLSAHLPAGTELNLNGNRSAVALSADGRMIAYAATTEDGAAIFVRPVDRFDAVKVAGSERGSAPFFSPNGDWIAFVANGRLNKIPVGGGAAIPVCELVALRGAVWLPDDTIVLASAPTGPLMRVPAQGGALTPLTTLDTAQHEKTHRSPVALPGGKAIVFVIGSSEIGTYDEARIVALNLETKEITELVKGAYGPAYSPTGHLLYVRDSSVFAVPFDPVSLKTSGSPVQVLKDVATLPSYGAAEFAVSATGAMIYAEGGDRSPRVSIHLVTRTGEKKPRLSSERSFTQIAMSPDGGRLGLIVSGANNVLWSYDMARDQMTRVTFRLDVEGPVWTRDNAHLTYWTGTDVRTSRADGSGSEKVVIPAAELNGLAALPESWSEGDQTLAFSLITARVSDVALYSVRDRKMTMFSATRFDEFGARFSPDGKWLAFVSDLSGRHEVYVQAVEGSDRKYPVSNNGSDIVRWTASGRELILGTSDGLMAASFAPGPTPSIGRPAILIGNSAEAITGLNGLEPTPDGKAFAALYRGLLPRLTEIRVVTNWLPDAARVR